MQNLDQDHVDEDNRSYPCLSQQKSVRITVIEELLGPNRLRSKLFIRGNTCILKVNNNYLLNIRNVNYHIDKNGMWYHANSDKSIDTMNEFVVLEPGTFRIRHHYIFDTPPQKTLYRGLEDIRLICHDNHLMYCASYQNENDFAIGISSSYYTIDVPILPICAIPSPVQSLCEKNWAMFNHKGKLKFMYRWHPMQVGVVSDKGELQLVDQSCNGLPFFRFIKNSSIGVPDVADHSIWFLVHMNSANHCFRTYFHCFVVLDDDTLEIKRISKCFTFEAQKIEYCLGFVLETDKLVFTYTTFDHNPKIMECPRPIIESLMMTQKIEINKKK
jgi:hypothetical protein